MVVNVDIFFFMEQLLFIEIGLEGILNIIIQIQSAVVAVLLCWNYGSLSPERVLKAWSVAHWYCIGKHHVLYKLILILYHHAHDFHVMFTDKCEVREFLSD